MLEQAVKQVSSELNSLILFGQSPKCVRTSKDGDAITVTPALPTQPRARMGRPI